MDSFAKSSDMPVVRWEKGSVTDRTDTVAEEVPVALVYNGISHVVMLATPADLEDFALGFSLTEGILESPKELYACDIVEMPNGIRVEMDISSERFVHLKERRRNLAGRTGCGLCGTDSLSQAVRMPAPVKSAGTFSVLALRQAFSQMEGMQSLKEATGATHAAAWMDDNGRVQCIREDVGRHNALDKLIGALTRSSVEKETGAVLVTSRASYEMVQKCASAKIGVLAAISAPTGLAVRMAAMANMTLVGFVRQSGHTVYTHPERLI